MVAFNSVPAAIRVPFLYAEFDNSGAVEGSTALAYKVMLFGNKLSAGTQTALTPVLITSAKQAEGLFGRGSQLAVMVAAFLVANPFTECWATPIADNGAGAAAAGVFSIVGPATATGTLNVYIGGKNYPIAVTAGQIATSIATALAAAITADLDAQVLGVVDGTDAFKVNVTHKHKGAFGNDLDIRLNYNDETTPAGVAVTITAMAGGTTNPDITAAIAAIGDEQYRVIVLPYNDSANLTLIETEMERRWGPLTQNDGHVFLANTLSVGAAQTFGLTRNTPFSTSLNLYKSPSSPWEIAAALGGVAAYNSSIDPARPLQTLALTGIKPPKPADRLLLTQRNTLLYSGISTAKADSGGVVRIERLVTMYRESPSGVDDISYLNYERMATLAYLRYDFRTTMLNKYPRHKLADDGIQFAAGQFIMTPKLGKAEAVAIGKRWAENGLIENFDAFKAGVVVERNATDPDRLDFLLPPDIINGLTIIAARIAFKV